MPKGEGGEFQYVHHRHSVKKNTLGKGTRTNVLGKCLGFFKNAFQINPLKDSDTPKISVRSILLPFVTMNKRG